VDVSHYFGGQDLPAGLGDYVWLDNNRDGLQSVGEPGIAGVTVTLYNASGTPVMTTTTNAQGYYSFTQLLPGTYSVGFLPPRNFLLTVQGPDDSRGDDSNANVLTGLTRPVTLSAGEFNPTIDAGMFTTNPAITIKKYVNGNDADTAPGPIVLTTAPVTWTYIITNTGDVTLTRISLSDDKLGVVVCPRTELAPGQSMLCQATGKATAGQYANLGTVTAYDQLISNCAYPSTCDVTPLTASDPAHYFGAGPQLTIVKAVTPGGPLPIAPGQTLTYTLRVTNTGNFTATNVMVRDNIPVGATYIDGSAKPPPVSGPNPLVWNLGTLGPSQTVTVSFAVRVQNQLTVTAIVNRAQAWSAELEIVESNQVTSVLAQTNVALTDFRVLREGDANKVIWHTSDEVNTFGFAIYRAESEDRADAVLLSKEMVAAKGAGSSYAFVDEAAPMGTYYRYWLIEVESDGSLNEYGPVVLPPIGAPSVAAPAAANAANVVAGGVPLVLVQPEVMPVLPTPLEPLNAANAQKQVVVSTGSVETSNASAPVSAEPAVPATLEGLPQPTNSAAQPIHPAQTPNQLVTEPAANTYSVVESAQPPEMVQADEVKVAQMQHVAASVRVVEQPASPKPNATSPFAMLWRALGVMLAIGLAIAVLGGVVAGVALRSKIRPAKF
jgi:uncharacterized repeat protein (TIGR01451 family)